MILTRVPPPRGEVCKLKPTGKLRRRLSRKAPRLDRAPPFSPTSASAKTRLSEQAQLSQKTFPLTPSLPAIRRKSFVKFNNGVDQMSESHGIPFLDLVTPHVELEQELTAVFQKALRTAGFIGGAMVENFERGICNILPDGTCGCGQQRHGRFAVRAGCRRGQDRRCRDHRPAHIYRDHGSHFTGWGATRICRHRRAHLQHGPRQTAHLPGRAMHTEGSVSSSANVAADQ